MNTSPKRSEEPNEKPATAEPKPKAKRERKPAFYTAVIGREKVPVYYRRTPTGGDGYVVVNYSSGKRRFNSYPTAELAIEAATKLAGQLSECEVLAARMTNEQAAEYSAAVLALRPFSVGLLSAAQNVADSLRIIGGFASMDALKLAAAQGLPLPDLSELTNAATVYKARAKKVTPKRVDVVVAELLKAKKGDEASDRYLEDLRSRLNRFAADFQRNIDAVTAAEVNEWIDGRKVDGKTLSPQTKRNFKRVIHLLFGYAVAHGYAEANPLDGYGKGNAKVKRSRANRGDVALFHAVGVCAAVVGSERGVFAVSRDWRAGGPSLR